MIGLRFSQILCRGDALTGETVRFYLGEAYESEFNGAKRWALVVKLAKEGTVATLRFADSQEERTLSWNEVDEFGWQRLAQK
jgi:hypothetical protein